MHVLMISPGFPDDMPYFTRALASVGARVLGVGDQPPGALAPRVREALSDYLHVGDLWNEQATVHAVRQFLRGRSVGRVECLWEPGMMLAARLREALGVPGLDAERTVAFRDKVRMKEVLDRAGVRVPRHARARSKAEVWSAADHVGFPMIVKPVDGAGSADTFRVEGPEGLGAVLDALQHVHEVTCEEYVDGEEFTFDTVCIRGSIAFENIAWYRPKPLVARQEPWISPQAIVLRDLGVEPLQGGRDLGRRALDALGFETGFAHMEWFRTASGEAVFGEVGARSPGGRLTHGMNYACDTDLFSGWAEAVCHGSFSQPTERRYNAAMVFKRAHGSGIVRSIEGLDGLLGRYGPHVAHLDLVQVGQPSRDWRQVVTGDGWLVVRHPDLSTTLEMADRFATDLRILAS